jgi:hypothetical protein
MLKMRLLTFLFAYTHHLPDLFSSFHLVRIVNFEISCLNEVTLMPRRIMAVVVMDQNRGTSSIEYFWNSSLNQSNSLISLPKKAISVTNMCDITFLIFVITSITFTLIINFN